MTKKIYLSLVAIITMMLAWNKAGAQTYHITGHTMYNQCGAINGTITTDITGYVPGLTMTLDYGDGGSANYPTDSGTVYYYHTYTALGTYTIKAILVDNGNDIDSTTFTYDNQACDEYDLVLFGDQNGNCIFDGWGTDYVIYSNPATVQIDSDGITVNTVTFTGVLNYGETGPVGTVYTYTLLTPPVNYSACGATTVTHTITALYSYSAGYLGFDCSATTFDLAFNGWFSAGIDGAGSHMFISNQSCEPQAATVALQFDNTRYSYAYNTGSYPATVSGNTVTFNVGTVSSLQGAYFCALFNPIGTLVLGDHVTTTWTVNPIAGDANPLNNTQTEIDSLGLSHDPNGKGVFPAGIIDAGTKLTYTIGFENTGTAAAQNIHIMDTLDANVDATTLAVVASDHKMNTQIIKNGTQTIVKFDFPNINLLDSSHHGQCDGAVTYTVKAKSNLPQGTHIYNEAGIYFDANAVVMTNKTVNTIGHPENVAVLTNAAVSVYPNPVSEELNVATDGNYTNLQVTNTVGQVLMHQAVNSSKTVVNVKALPAGIYYISLQGANGVKTQKFEKL